MYSDTKLIIVSIIGILLFGAAAEVFTENDFIKYPNVIVEIIVKLISTIIIIVFFFGFLILIASGMPD